jgi:hypothetical protein
MASYGGSDESALFLFGRKLKFFHHLLEIHLPRRAARRPLDAEANVIFLTLVDHEPARADRALDDDLVIRGSPLMLNPDGLEEGGVGGEKVGFHSIPGVIAVRFFWTWGIFHPCPRFGQGQEK